MAHGDLKGVRFRQPGSLCISNGHCQGQRPYRRNRPCPPCRLWLTQDELFYPEDFGLEDSRPTKRSDCYALGMLIYEVLSGQVPFFQHDGRTIVVRVFKGERPGRPQGAGGTWFTDEVWGILERCWKPLPGDRPRIKDVLQCLEKVSRSWMPPPSPRTAAGPPTTDPPTQNSDSSAEESTDEGEVSSPSQAISSQPSRKPPLKGTPDKNSICPPAHEFSALPYDAPDFQDLGTSVTNPERPGILDRVSWT